MIPRSLSLVALSALFPWSVAGCSRQHAAAPPVEVVVASTTVSLPSDPLDAKWAGVPEFPAAMILQDMVEPRLLEPSTLEVRVKALTDGSRVAFRMEWNDAQKNDLPMPAHFTDACAVQVPSIVTPDVPAPQMGEPGKPVEIAYWRASWQAVVDGRGDTINDIYPNASVDHYPFEAPSLPEGSDAKREMTARYAPARALGNRMAGPRDRPVEDLVAEGPGTLAPAASTESNGRGLRTSSGWAVVITRRMPNGLAPGRRSQVAFAVWAGEHGEIGARKMRTGWTPMLYSVTP